MKSKAVTLVHKGAMNIAVHAVSSFARHFTDTHVLDIHTDGSPDEADEAELLRCAGSMECRIVRPDDRRDALQAALSHHPQLLALFDRGGYFAKLQLAVTIPPPFFYFDSDIVWLRPVENLASATAKDTFSIESWSWYFGMLRDAVWIREGIPRRVNSGFYHLSSPFPTERLARLFEEGLYTPDHRYSTDQEMMAFLYPELDCYHPDDMKRSRRGILYDLATDQAAALHFPGRMWEEHMTQIKLLEQTTGRPPVKVRYQPAVALDRLEILRMRASLAAAATPVLSMPIGALRWLRARLR
jgi:hypothetical protein